ncbi:MAG: hypothetical protein HKN48_06875 [Flavobacteriaceae bacterium]|nr:hypothetical protein [Flavobacteriaceae bacterium]
MKQNDPLNELFDNLKGSFDTQETPPGHQQRFLQKLEANRSISEVKVRKINWWKPLSIAATLVILLTAGVFFQNSEVEPQGLASVSEEMEQTQSFFVTAINEELETLKSFENADTKVLIDDTLKRLNTLEEEYKKLVIDLAESGNDKRVITAMIANFQNRIELLQQVIENIEEIEKLKANRDEITI